MGFMFDAAGGNIPATATDILIPTDGDYAKVGAELRQRFPHATFHTYSALGLVPAQWVDVETGCVWPPARAVNIWRAWRDRGCHGFYCARSTRTTLEGLLTDAERAEVEWFEADPTGVAHVLAGDVATQYLWTASYDESETTPAFEDTTPPPAPAPPLPAPTAVTSTDLGDVIVRTLTEAHVNTDANGDGWFDFPLGASHVAGAPWAEAAAPGAIGPGRYDTVHATPANGGAAGFQRVQITGGIANTSYAVNLPVTP